MRALEAADAARRREAQRVAERAQQKAAEKQRQERARRAADAKVQPELFRFELHLKCLLYLKCYFNSSRSARAAPQTHSSLTWRRVRVRGTSLADFLPDCVLKGYE